MSSASASPARRVMKGKRRIAVMEELFQGSPVAGLGEQDQMGLVWDRRLLANLSCMIERGVDMNKGSVPANKYYGLNNYEGRVPHL